MNEPKRRGRPPKAKPNAQVEGANVGCAECGQAVGHYDDCSVGMGVVVFGAKEIIESIPQEKRAEVAAQMQAKSDAMRDDINAQIAQAYANRVWSGQSPEVPRAERMRRVKLALDGQGLSMEGVVL